MQYVYMLRAGHKHYKVGISHNVHSRVSGLQAYNPEKIVVITSKFMDTEAYNIEQELHKSLEAMQAAGANEWFVLTPEQALKLCAKIHAYPDMDISERVTLARLMRAIEKQQKLFDRKLDYVINTYQKSKKFISIIPVSTQEKISAHEKSNKKHIETDTYKLAEIVVKNEGKASTSMLQRHMRIGYGRAARLIDELEKNGVISSSDGSRPRSVIIQS